MVERTGSTLVIVREKLRFIGRNVDVGWAFALTPFTRETEVHRFFNCLIPPTALEQFALKHFKKQMRSTSSRMDLLPCHLIARTHRSSISLAAGTYTNTPLGRLFQ